MRATRARLSCLEIFERGRWANSREMLQPTRTGAHRFFPVLSTNTAAWFDEEKEGECVVHARLLVPLRATHLASISLFKLAGVVEH
jgi:hypothetical protein